MVYRMVDLSAKWRGMTAGKGWSRALGAGDGGGEERGGVARRAWLMGCRQGLPFSRAEPLQHWTPARHCSPGEPCARVCDGVCMCVKYWSSLLVYVVCRRACETILNSRVTFCVNLLCESEGNRCRWQLYLCGEDFCTCFLKETHPSFFSKLYTWDIMLN